MINWNYKTLLNKYKEVVEENKQLKASDDPEQRKLKNNYRYYFNTSKKQVLEIRELKDEIKKLKKEIIELSILIDYLREENETKR